jgi:hypothetical protein
MTIRDEVNDLLSEVNLELLNEIDSENEVCVSTVLEVHPEMTSSTVQRLLHNKEMRGELVSREAKRNGHRVKAYRKV